MKSFYVLLAFIFGWLIAQCSKLVIAEVKTKGKLSLKEAFLCLIKSGGMPSGHTSSFMGVAMTIGFLEGFDSAVFGLALAMTAIIVYDATNVRYAVGQHGKLLNDMLKKVPELKSEKRLKLVEGHTIPQVIVGGMIGIAVSFVLKMIFGY